jgi:hypothetical protein
VIVNAIEVDVDTGVLVARQIERLVASTKPPRVTKPRPSTVIATVAGLLPFWVS